MQQIKSNSGEIILYDFPDKCPFCHNSITPNALFGYIHKRNLEVLMSCPNTECENSFIGYYYYNNQNYKYGDRTSIGTLIGKIFSKEIKDTSTNFELIYNEAYKSEQQKLMQICGVGYRKALEFLIKDYSIQKNEPEKDKILRMALGNCIKTFIEDKRIQSVAKRAVWLGNDETHYVKKWEDKDLNDLKKLIDLTVHWIEMEKLTESFENEMPE
ncbi:DUF4145 domain-containing protein [Tenacibaculum finnmarkense genomovar ulcerans]|uniref:DUF4145 domain-containing protein n=1 Tax=Tenacibaculum finnmarkense TaxID=2781243 RepID=UPI00187B9836|nr:DUF4145 domain-containing protein [Tenacibaculum finnmarkense]MBE7635151.1 DUF4145 domain-containing protein [Tenacibaculum finnmarkense genomovar ulcerans]MCD8431124.1 DUF4145 domain-containing protein [Tenacibaculum finnmarkense genomovar ulcerans]